MTKITIRRVGRTDLETLQALSKRTFVETFGSVNTSHDMATYLQRAFAQEQLLQELLTPGSEFYFALIEDEIVGYLKFNQAGAQTEDVAPNALEVQRLYVCQKAQHMGVGRTLMDFALQRAQQCQRKAVWLGVWNQNRKAQAFYQQYGFVQVGQHEFILGTDHQIDNIVLKQLSN